MKNKKGFTLIEIIAVIAIMSIVIVIAVYSVKDSGKSVKEKDYATKVNLIETSAVFYGQDVLETFPQTVTIQTLLDNKYIIPDVEEAANNCGIVGGCLINPITNESMNSMEVIISITNNSVTAVLQ